MDWIGQFLEPRQDSFARLLIEQAAYTVEGIEAVAKYMEKRGAKHAARVKAAEEAADTVRRTLVDELNHTFVTPIEREDISALSRATQCLVGYAHTTVQEMEILGVEPDHHLRRMASLLRNLAGELLLATRRLKEHPNVAFDHAKRARALQNHVERAYREAVADLFQQPQDEEHIVQMLKLRETYRHLSSAADRGKQAADIIGDTVIKRK